MFGKISILQEYANYDLENDINTVKIILKGAITTYLQDLHNIQRETNSVDSGRDIKLKLARAREILLSDEKLENTAIHYRQIRINKLLDIIYRFGLNDNDEKERVKTAKKELRNLGYKPDMEFVKKHVGSTVELKETLYSICGFKNEEISDCFSIHSMEPDYEDKLLQSGFIISTDDKRLYGQEIYYDTVFNPLEREKCNGITSGNIAQIKGQTKKLTIN